MIQTEEAYVLMRRSYYLMTGRHKGIALVIAKLLVSEFPKILTERRLSELAKIRINLNPRKVEKVARLPVRNDFTEKQKAIK